MRALRQLEFVALAVNLGAPCRSAAATRMLKAFDVKGHAVKTVEGQLEGAAFDEAFSSRLIERGRKPDLHRGFISELSEGASLDCGPGKLSSTITTSSHRPAAHGAHKLPPPETHTLDTAIGLLH